MTNDSNWQPIESAKKTAARIMLSTPDGVYFGWWDEDKFTRRAPRPYWTHEMVRSVGVNRLRARQPTHWQPVPERATP